MEEMNALVGHRKLRSSLSPSAANLTRAVQPPSETVARVFSTLMPAMEVSHARLPYGAEKLYFNAQYVLFDNTAECHKPKDKQRLEVALVDGIENQLRQQVLQDVLQLSEQIPISAAWWRQDMALEVEAGRVTSQQRQRAAHIASAPAPAAIPTYDIEEILREVKTTGAAQAWFLVRWSGCDPTWEAWRIYGEAGSPIDTWEPLKTVRWTEAYAHWQSAKRQQVLEGPSA